MRLLPNITDRAIEVGYTAIFYYHNLLRGLGRSMIDPLEKPEFTEYLTQTSLRFFYRLPPSLLRGWERYNRPYPGDR